VRSIPFGTLRQHCIEGRDELPEVALLCPWDLVAATDWRRGCQSFDRDIVRAISEAEEFLELLDRRKMIALAYLAAPILPVTANLSLGKSLETALLSVVHRRGAFVIDGKFFSIGGYLRTGTPVTGDGFREVASGLASSIASVHSPKKVLVTDLDNTWWSGSAAEDGASGVSAGQDGEGYKHHIYQTLAQRLTEIGVALVAVTRNDQEVVDAVWRADEMPVGRDCFSAVLASYQPKSAQIAEIASQLNLGLESFVFVDDNLIEIEEVSRALPSVSCLQFPKANDTLVSFIDELSGYFNFSVVTEDDRLRTGRYQRMLAGTRIRAAAPSDLTSYLIGLKMCLTVHDRTIGGRDRALQLINKTNQFNLNGRRWTEHDLQSILESGGRLITASLEDTAGSHGEILAFLVDRSKTVLAFVLSCRVFQRRVEHAFVHWFCENHEGPFLFDARRTPRNEPFYQFANEALGADSSQPSFFVSAGVNAGAFARDLPVVSVIDCRGISV
jgi:FkbH-like protein